MVKFVQFPLNSFEYIEEILLTCYLDQQLKVKFGLIKTILSIKIFLYKHFALCDKNIDLTNFEKKKISHSKKQATYFDEKYYKKVFPFIQRAFYC